MKLVTVIVLVMSVCMAGIVLANDPVAGSIRSGDTIGKPFEGNRDFIEGWNVDQELDGSWSYGAPCQGPTYVAGTSYYLDRVEFMGGVDSGPCTIEIRADDGSGCPSGALLASGSFNQVVELGWQGADLDSPVMIVEGMTYHINYVVVVGSPCSFSLDGVMIPHCWSDDCSAWSGPETYFNWMVKFFGTEPVSSENDTWTSIKDLYR